MPLIFHMMLRGKLIFTYMDAQDLQDKEFDPVHPVYRGSFSDHRN